MSMIKPYNLISDHQYTLDLKECNKEILIKSGVQSKHILKPTYVPAVKTNIFFRTVEIKGKRVE